MWKHSFFVFLVSTLLECDIFYSYFRCPPKRRSKNNPTTNSWKWSHLSSKQTCVYSSRKWLTSNPSVTISRWIEIWSSNSTTTLSSRSINCALRSWTRRPRGRTCRWVIIPRLRYFCKNWNCYSTSKKKLIWIFKKTEMMAKARKTSTTKTAWKTWKKRNKT